MIKLDTKDLEGCETPSFGSMKSYSVVEMIDTSRHVKMASFERLQATTDEEARAEAKKISDAHGWQEYEIRCYTLTAGQFSEEKISV